MKISVALCTYNGEKYLKEQLDSILSQSVLPDEIVVCDDVSTDSTQEILRSYQRKYPNIFKIYFNEVNLGYVDNFEKAIQKCTGDYIFLCDQDDVWFLEKVAEVKKIIKQYPNKEIFCHNLEVLLPSGEIVSQSFFNNENFDIHFNNSEILTYLVFEKNVFPGMCMCISSTAKSRYFPLQKIDKKIIHDYELAIKGSRDNHLIIISKALAYYRQHSGQAIGIDINKLSSTDLTITFIHSKLCRIPHVDKIIKSFFLDPNLLVQYKKFCKDLYKRYLKLQKFPFLEHLKIKYYYKILNELK